MHMQPVQLHAYVLHAYMLQAYMLHIMPCVIVRLCHLPLTFFFKVQTLRKRFIRSKVPNCWPKTAFLDMKLRRRKRKLLRRYFEICARSTRLGTLCPVVELSAPNHEP